MKKFWGYIENDRYAVGCTGQTTYVYDRAGRELAKFRKDILYAYTPVFCPGKDVFVVKAAEGRMAVYSLEKMALIKKFRFGYAGSHGCCFSPDGNFFYNIEEIDEDALDSVLSVYETENFTRLKILFAEDKRLVLNYIEYDSRRNSYFVLGYRRIMGRVDGKPEQCDLFRFVAEFKDETLIRETEISEETWWFLSDYKHLELLGFTEQAKEWSALRCKGYDLNDIQNEKHHLADYIKE